MSPLTTTCLAPICTIRFAASSISATEEISPKPDKMPASIKLGVATNANGSKSFLGLPHFWVAEFVPFLTSNDWVNHDFLNFLLFNVLTSHFNILFITHHPCFQSRYWTACKTEINCFLRAFLAIQLLHVTNLS